MLWTSRFSALLFARSVAIHHVQNMIELSSHAPPEVSLYW